ncbi:hypothetical protein TOK_2604 [Pseudonocardia sp. N23]|nr:hypothetical protein TOK_2604 [Pseudonocardia sp. N23]
MDGARPERSRSSWSDPVPRPHIRRADRTRTSGPTGSAVVSPATVVGNGIDRCTPVDSLLEDEVTR